MNTKNTETPCSHPSHRLYCIYTYNPFTGNAKPEPQNLWIGCMDCGDTLRAPEWESKLKELEKAS